jgi:hypothetical protein
MITGGTGRWESFRKSKEEIKGFGRKRKGVKQFYERQSEFCSMAQARRRESELNARHRLPAIPPSPVLFYR